MEKSATECIVAYCKYKNKVFKERTGITYMDKRDYADIRKWSEEEAYVIRKTLVTNIFYNIGTILLGVSNCPFCLKHSTQKNKDIVLLCDECPYGKRHGKCVSNSNSTYQQLFTKMLSAIAFTRDHKEHLASLLNSSI